MIDVITKREIGARAMDMEEMHRLRFRVFKERLQWDVQTIWGTERDEFDDLDCIYILALAETGCLVGTWRMLPTTGPYMLRDVFPDLMEDQALPCDPKFWECSRCAVETDGNGTGNNLASFTNYTSEIFCGLVEFCLANDICKIITVYDVRIARLLPRVGCTPTWRSRTRRIGNSLALAGLFDINEKVLSRIRQAGGVTESVIRHFPKFDLPTAA